MVKISLCMIVKNEEKTLERCLLSVRNLVDEIIIVDTESEDKTKEIAKKFTDKIYDFSWCDDFSAARNFSFSKATGDFILWLDADDVFLENDREKFLSLKEKLSQNTDVIMMRYNVAFDENKNPTFFFYRERLLRKDVFITWVGKVHEVISYRGKTNFSDIAVTHLSEKKEYPDRNLKIYEKQRENKIPFTPRDSFYYGRELYYFKKYEEAISVLTKFSEGEGWFENKVEAYRIISKCFEELGDFKSSKNAILKSFLYVAPRPDICCDIGSLFFKEEDIKTATKWFCLATKTDYDEKSGAFISEDYKHYYPLMMLCICYSKLGDMKKAEEYNLLAGTFRPNAKEYLNNLRYFKQLRKKE